MDQPFNPGGDANSLKFATLCLIVGFVAGLGLGVAALATDPTTAGNLPEGR